MPLTRTAFRALLGFIVLLAAAATFCDALFPGLVPSVLATAHETLDGSTSPAMSVACLIADIARRIAWGVSIYGLYFFRGWAPATAIGTSLLLLFTRPLCGPPLFSTTAFALFHLSAMLWGAILGVVLFSPLRQLFVAQSANLSSRGREEA